jgi:hypothetical protein
VANKETANPGRRALRQEHRAQERQLIAWFPGIQAISPTKQRRLVFQRMSHMKAKDYRKLPARLRHDIEREGGLVDQLTKPNAEQGLDTDVQQESVLPPESEGGGLGDTGHSPSAEQPVSV